jgi:hypothetical protein
MWERNYRVMPLPDLVPGEGMTDTLAVSFDEVGTIATAHLPVTSRVACLSDFGILVLQQRHVNHYTRYVVETAVLYEQTVPMLTEVELLEDWLSASLEDDTPNWEARCRTETTAFTDFVDAMRNDLRDPYRRSSVRSRVRQEIQTRFGM